MKRWFQGLFAAARLEMVYTRRHPQQWVICALMPVLWLLIVANTFGTGLMTRLPVGLVNLDAGPMARQLVTTLDAVPSFRLQAYATLEEAEAALRSAETFGTIVIPADYTKASLNGRGATIEFQVNKSYYAVGTILEVDAKTALASLAKDAGTVKMTMARGGSFAATADRLRVEMPEVFFLGNTGFNFCAYLLPTLIPGLIGLAAGLTFVGVLVREWRDGGVGRLLATARGFPSAAILGKLLPWFVFYVLLGLGWVFGITGILGWTAAGSLWLWSAATFFLVAAMAGIAVLFTSVSISWPIAVSTVICFAAPSFPFTGFSYPLDSMTPGAAFFGNLLPLTHYLALQGECWVLDTPVDAFFLRLLPLVLLSLVPLSAGVPILGHRLLGWAKKEENTARTPDERSA